MNVRDMQIEYKACIAFALIALLLSLLAGLIAGIEGSVVAVRAVFSTVFFAGLGYAVVHVLKKFVPEFSEMFRGTPGGEDQDSIDVEATGSRDSGEAGTASDEGEAGPASEYTVPAGDGFSELSQADFPHLKSSQGGDGLNDSLSAPGGGDEYAGGKVNPSKGKMGKHIIANEALFKYEPKIMAEAVRTMMRKGEE